MRLWPFTRQRPEARNVNFPPDILRRSHVRFGDSTTVAASLTKSGGWLGIAARPVVDRIAGLDWQGISDAGEELEKSPLVDLLQSPNSQCHGAMLLRITAQALVLSGEAYLLKVRGARTGRPRQLVPISPDRVARVWKDDSALEYHVAPAELGEPKVYPAEDMLRIWRPLPADPWEPYGAVQMVVHEVEAEAAWRESVRNWFDGDARPSMALEFGDQYQMPGEIDEFIRGWIESYNRRRTTEAGIPALLPPGAKMRELSGLGTSENLTPTEQALRSKILSALGVPPFLLGAAHEANRASAEASLWAFDFSAVKPWASLITCAVNHQLGPDFPGQRVQFRDWVWRDRLAESEIDERLLQQKVISPNEAREKRNLPPTGWGDLPVGQMQDQPYNGERNDADFSNPPQRGR
jgi:HK97 family phage portal protein